VSDNRYTLGLDYGTNSVRALIVNAANGREVATAVWNYSHGTNGVILSRDPNLARQHPADYVSGAESTIKKALATARRTVRGFKPEQIIGIGVDTTGSTPLPVDALGRPLALDRRFAKDPTPEALADQIERLLTGNYAGWDVDDFEMQGIRDSQLQDLHRRCMSVGLPEEWPKLSDEQKNQLRDIIVELRELGDARKQGQAVN